MAKKEEKTNVMRVLDSKKVSYRSYCYLESGVVSGMEVAAELGQNPNRVFKTLFTVGKSGANYVFVVPVCKELDLKKAAGSVGEKNIEMVKSKDLLGLTGYIHGGCSPIGMKRFFRTVLDADAADLETILFSGGKIGYQVEVAVEDLKKVIRLEMADLTVDGEVSPLPGCRENS